MRMREGLVEELLVSPSAAKVFSVFTRLMNKQNRVYGSTALLMQECGITNWGTWKKALVFLTNPENPYLIKYDGFYFVCPYDATKTNAEQVEVLKAQWHNKFHKTRISTIDGTLN